MMLNTGLLLKAESRKPKAKEKVGSGLQPLAFSSQPAGGAHA